MGGLYACLEEGTRHQESYSVGQMFRLELWSSEERAQQSKVYRQAGNSNPVSITQAQQDLSSTVKSGVR